MVRLVTCGWETGDINEAGLPAGGGGFTVGNTNPVPRSPSAYWARCSNSLSSNNLNFPFGVNTSEIWVRLSIYWSPGGSGEGAFIRLLDSAGAVQGALTGSTSDNLLRVYTGSSSTLLGTSTTQFSFNAWHTVELHWQMLSLTNGNVELWVDGVQWLNLTGVDNVQTSNLNMATIRLCLDGFYPGNNTILYDDLAVNDTTGATNNGRIGDGRVVLLMPNGPGTTTNQLRAGTDTGANWSQVNEVPLSMSQYVYSAVPGTRDTYSVADIPAGSWQINSVDVIAYAQLSDATGGFLAPTLKSGPTTVESPQQTLTVTAAYIRQHYELDPNTNGAWAVSAVNGLEVGTTVR